MEEEIRTLFLSKDQVSRLKAIELLRIKSKDLILDPSKFDSNKANIETFLSSFQKAPENFPEDEWNMNIFALCLFYLSICPKENRIEFLRRTFQFNGDGTLFCILNNTLEDPSTAFENIYKLFCEQINDESRVPFYSTTPDIYLKHIVKMALADNNSDKLRKIESFLETSNMRLRSVAFYNIIFNLIDMFQKRQIPVEPQVFDNLLAAAESLPSIVVSQRFSYSIFNNGPHDVPKMSSQDRFTMIQKTAKLLYKVRNRIDADFYPFHTSCLFLKQINESQDYRTKAVCTQIVSFLANKMICPSKKFSNDNATRATQDFIKDTIPAIIRFNEVFCILAQGVICSFSNAIEFLAEQNGVCSNFSEIGPTPKGFILFSEQPHSLCKTSFLDYYLASKFEPDVCENAGKVKAEKQQKANEMIMQLHYCMWLTVELLNGIKNRPTPAPVDFILKSAKLFAEAIIEISRNTYLSLVSNVIENSSVKSQPSIVPERLFNECTDKFVKLACDFKLQIQVVEIFATTLARKVRKGRHSLKLIKPIDKIFDKQVYIQVLHKLYLYVMQQVTADATSNKAEDMNELFQVFLFTMRIAEKMEIEPNPEFGDILKKSEKAFIYNKLLHLVEKTTNQEPIFKMITFFYKCLELHCKDLPKSEMDFKMNMGNVSSSSRKARAEAYIAIMYQYQLKKNLDDDTATIIKEGLESDDKDTVLKASIIFRREIGRLHNKNYTNNSIIRPLYAALMNAIPKLPPQEVINISQNVLTDYGLTCLYTQPYSSSEDGFMLPETNLSITKLLLAINSSKLDVLDVPHVLSLASYCIEVIKKDYHSNIFNMHEVFDILHVVVCDLFKYQKMPAKVHAFYARQHQFFADIIAEGGTNTYIMSLINASAFLGTGVNHYALMEANEFLKILKTRNPKEYIIENMLDDMVTYFPASNILSATNNGFSVIQKNFPGIIKFKHLNILLQTFNQKRIAKSSDPSITTTFSRVLHEVLLNLSDEEKEKFMNFAFNYGSNMLMFGQNKLLKRMGETGICIKIDKLDPQLPVFKICAALACGFSSRGGRLDGQYCTLQPYDRQTITNLINVRLNGNHVMKMYQLAMLFRCISRGPYVPQLFGQPSQSLDINVFLNAPFKQTIPPKYKVFLDIFKHVPANQINGIKNYAASARRFDSKSPTMMIIKTLPTLVDPSILNDAMDVFIRLSHDPINSELSLTAVSIVGLFNFVPFIARPECMELIRGAPVLMNNFICAVSDIIAFPDLPFSVNFKKPILDFLVLYSEFVFRFTSQADVQEHHVESFISWAIMNDKTKKLIVSFMKTIDATHPRGIFPLYLDILSNISHSDIIKGVDEFKETTAKLFVYFYDQYSNYNFETDTGSLIPTSVIEAYCCNCIANPNPQDIVNFSKIFKFPIFRRSGSYVYFKKEYEKLPESFRLDVLEYIADKFEELDKDEMMVALRKMVKLIPTLTSEKYQHIANKLINASNNHLDTYDLKVIPATQIITCLSEYLWKTNPENEYKQGPLLKLYSIIPSFLEMESHESIMHGFRCLYILDKLGTLYDDLWCECVAKTIISPLFNTLGRSTSQINLYYPQISKLINLKRNLLTPVPKVINQAINIIVLDNLTPVYDVVSNDFIRSFLMFISDFPEMKTCLPFSPYLIIANALAKELQKNTKVDEKFRAIMFAISHIKKATSATQEEKDALFYQVAKTMKIILDSGQQQDIKKLSNQCIKMPEYNYNNFPAFLIESVDKKPENQYELAHFHIIMQATEFLPREIMGKYIDSMKAVIHNFRKFPKNQRVLPNYANFIRKAVLEYGLEEDVKKAVQSIIDRDSFDLKINLLIQLIETGVYGVQKLLDIWEEFKNAENSAGVFHALCLSIDQLTNENKIEYAKGIVALAQSAPKLAELFINFIGTNGVLQKNAQVRDILFEAVPYIFCTYNVLIPPVLVDMAKNASCVIYTQILIAYSTQASPFCRIRCLNTIHKMFPGSPKERFEFFLSSFMPVMWVDKCMPMILLAISPKFDSWHQLCALAPMLLSQNVDFTRGVFKNLIQAGAEGIPSLLNNIIMNRFIPRFIERNTTILGIALAMEDCEVPIDPIFAVKISKRTSDVSLCLNSLSEYKLLDESILPNMDNDFVFAAHRNELSNKGAAAAIQLLLTNVKEACTIFQGMDANEFSNQTLLAYHSVALRLSKGDNEKLSTVVGRILNKENYVTKYLNDAQPSMDAKSIYPCIENLLCRRYSVSILSSELLIMLQIINNFLISRKNPSTDYTQFVNGAFCDFIGKFVNRKKDASAPSPVMRQGIDDSLIIFPESTYETIFKNVVGITQFGEIVTCKSQLFDVISSLGQLASSESKTGYKAIAEFFSTMYQETLAPDMIRRAIHSYTKYLNQEVQQLKQTDINEAVSRIVTFITICVKSNSDKLFTVMRDEGEIVNGMNPELLRMWIHQLYDVINNQYFSKIKDFFSSDPLSMISAYSLNKEYQNPSKDPKFSLATIKHIERFSDLLFNKLSDYIDEKEIYTLADMIHALPSTPPLETLLDYNNKSDLAKEVRRILLLKPEIDIVSMISEIDRQRGNKFYLEKLQAKHELFTQAFNNVNAALPITIQKRTHRKEAVSIVRFADEIRKINDKEILITFISDIGEKNTLIIHRRKNNEPSRAVTASVFVDSMNAVFNSTYATASRGIHIGEYLTFEVGNHYIATVLTGNYVPVSTFLKIDDTSEENIERCKKLAVSFASDANDLVKRRISFLRSLGTALTIPMFLHMKPSYLFMSVDKCDFFISRNNIVFDSKDLNASIPPALEAFLGQYTHDTVLITSAAATYALSRESESIRSTLETSLVRPKMFGMGDMKFYEQRKAIEEALHRVTPPKMSYDEKSQFEWFENIDALLSN